MADATVKHAFVSAIPEGTDATKIRTSNWNAALLFSAGADGEVLTRSAASATGAAWSAAPVDLSTLVRNNGTQSVYVGVAAGNLTVSGVGQNTVIGYQAGTALTTGYQNTIVGRTAGAGLTVGYGNVYLGTAAGLSSQDGHYNNFIGQSAGTGTTSGYQNNFMGAFAGSANTLGWNNTFLGDSAGRLNTTGISNAMVGRSAGDANTTGNYAAFLGHQAGFRNTTGSFNTMLGDASGLWNTTGSNNTFVGELAGATTVDANANVTGDKNTCLGYNSGPSAVTQFSKSTAIGQGAMYGANNALILGGTGATDFVNVGIGLTTPLYKLDAVGQTFLFGSDNTSDVLRTNATNKVGRMFAPHYLAAEEPVFVIGGVMSSTANIVFIGGGTVNANAATRIEFVTAATSAVTTGTSRWVIDENGWLVSQSANYDISGFRHLKSVAGYWEGTEMTAPAAGAVNSGRVYFEDSAGKTRMMVKFNTGAAVQLAIEP